MLNKEFFYKIPKAELHVHLEGTLEPNLKLELAKKNNIDIGLNTVEEVEKTYHYSNLTSFLNVYYSGMKVLIEEDDFYKLAYSYFKKAKENNVRYCECFFDPQAHTQRGIKFKTFMNGYLKAKHDAEKNLNIKINYIMCFLRDLTEESAIEHYEMSKEFKNSFIAVGLDSDELNNPPEKFKNIFKTIKNDGYLITMHCDVDQLNSIKNISTVINDIKVDRIDHGTNIVEDENLVNIAKNKNLAFTCCPISNKFIVNDFKSKEIKNLLNKDLMVTINSDDPAYFKGYISDNYFAVYNEENLNLEEIKKLAVNSFKATFLTLEEKNKYIKEVENFFKTID